jgi:hypothetical protein
MAVIKSATFSGLPIDRVRIDSTIRASDMIRVAEQQSHLWELITATGVDGGAPTATPHDHGVNGGVVIPTPLAHHHLGASILPSSISRGGAFIPLSYFPIYAPAGLEGVRVVGVVPDAVSALGIRVRMYDYDSSGFEAGFFAEVISPPLVAGYTPPVGTVRLTWEAAIPLGLSSGKWVGVEVSIWDGDDWIGSADIGGVSPFSPVRHLDDVIVLPYTSQPSSTSLPAETYVQPGQVEQSLPSDFLPVDDRGVESDFALPSWLANRCSRNDRIIRDALDRHTHSSGAASSSESGVAFSRPLLSHAYGVMRRYEGAPAEQIDFDRGLSPQTWSGRIFAPCLRLDAGTTAQTLSRHRVQIPAASDADIGATGTTSRLQAAALIYYVSGVTLYARLLDTTGLNGGTERSTIALSSSAPRRRLLRINNIMSSTVTAGRSDQVLQIRGRRSTDPVTNRSLGVYGCGLAMVDA